ncbi:MAG: PorV/PorQ family protein, partial [Candidatus Margulisbacteria bacterium]|nr:PorV/PorQ family protein [Candidatus Margulisiibacteriota bacterium]
MLFNIIKQIIFILFIFLTFQVNTFAGQSADISKIGTGARTLGMGKTFIAIADDPSAMFMNPAGLAQVRTPQVISMQANFFNDVNYFTLGGAMPFGPGSIALGLNQAYIDDIILTELNEDNRPYEKENVTYFEGIWTLAYGLDISNVVRDIFHVNFTGEMLGGASLKYFQKGVSNLSTGTGTNIDLGLIYMPDNKWNFGIAYRNILHSYGSLGSIGSINWDTGAQDYLLSYATIGVAYKINPRWTIASDYDIAFTDKRKALYHLGTEYHFLKNLFVRAGYEQMHDAVGSKTFGNLTFGLTIDLIEWKIDYAYHPYYELMENNTHYVSLRYSFGPMTEPKAPEIEVKPEPEPEPKATLDRAFNLNGQILDNKTNAPVQAKVVIKNAENNSYLGETRSNETG